MFVRIAVRLLWLLVVGAAVTAALAIPASKTISNSGGWGWLLIGGVYIVAATSVQSAHGPGSLMRTGRVFIVSAGALCGILWWVVSWMLGAQRFGIWGSNIATGAIAGVVTGIAVTAMSSTVYRRLPVRSLYWYSPLSVYISVAIYGVVILAIRQGIDDFHRDQIRLAVGAQSILGMWWGITFLLPFAAVVQLLAYLNHRILRRVFIGSHTVTELP